MPPYFRTRQLVLSDAEGRVEDERHGYWIDQVVQQILRVRGLKTFRWRQIAARTTFAVGAIVIAGLSYYLHQLDHNFHQLEHKLAETGKENRGLNEKIAQYVRELEILGGNHEAGKARCQSLIGEYALHQKYAFTVGIDTRSVATKGKWKASGCDYNEKHNAYILLGEEVTEFDVEFSVNDRYKRIAKADPIISLRY